MHQNKILLFRSLLFRPRAKVSLWFKPFCCWQKVLPKHKLELSSNLKIPISYREHCSSMPIFCGLRTTFAVLVLNKI